MNCKKRTQKLQLKAHGFFYINELRIFPMDTVSMDRT